MANGETRERFLIALAKFLGESPTERLPLADVQICEEWFISELLEPILPGQDRVILTRDKFNQLMLATGRQIAPPHFFSYFFGKTKTISDFEEAVENFRIRAMWLFGNFKFAYKKLATCNEVGFRTLIGRTEPRSTEEFTSRDVFDDIQPIPEQDLGFLGYISGQHLDDLALAVATLQLILSHWDDREAFLKQYGGDRAEKVAGTLKSEGYGLFNGGVLSGSQEEVSQALASLTADLEGRRTRQKNAQEIGQRNTQRYLVLPDLDVYVATSMRSDDDYVEQHKFVGDVFGSAHVRDLKLRYFDPTASYDPDRIKKGLIECLMLRRASVTIYNAGAEDTMGKDSELAATLAQGKPVIVYVKCDPRFVQVPGREKPVDMERRAQTFMATHPLGLQVSVRTGVAHGIVVVRTVDQCAKMLRKVLLH